MDERCAALDEEQGLSGRTEGIAEPCCNGANDIRVRAEGIVGGCGKWPYRTVNIRPGCLAFDTEHPAVALPEVAADLTAGDEAVDVVIEIDTWEEREANRIDALLAPRVPDVPTDVTTRPAKHRNDWCWRGLHR